MVLYQSILLWKLNCQNCNKINLIRDFQSLTDAVIGIVESNGRTFVMDMWTTGYLNPILEANQDIKNAEGKVEDGVTTIKFTRARDTGDSGQV
jgi:hypothetical protein